MQQFLIKNLEIFLITVPASLSFHPPIKYIFLWHVRIRPSVTSLPHLIFHVMCDRQSSLSPSLIPEAESTITSGALVSHHTHSAPFVIFVGEVRQQQTAGINWSSGSYHRDGRKRKSCEQYEVRKWCFCRQIKYLGRCVPFEKVVEVKRRVRTGVGDC